MAGPYYFDRVKDTSTTTGTGTLTLANSAPTGFRTFGSVLANSDTCFYTIVGGSEWEVGIGTYTTSGTTLARTRVLASSNSGSAVNLSAGTKDVFISLPANQFNWLPPNIKTPVNGDFSWTAQGDASVEVTSGGIYLTSTTGGGGSYNLRVRRKSAPSTPYTITAGFLMAASVASSGAYQAGLLWRQSSDGKAVTFSIENGVTNTGSFYSSQKLNTSLGYSSSYFDNKSYGLDRGTVWLRIADDGTNRSCWISADGQKFLQVGANQTRTDYLTADQVGFFINPINYIAGVTLFSWNEA